MVTTIEDDMVAASKTEQDLIYSRTHSPHLRREEERSRSGIDGKEDVPEYRGSYSGSYRGSSTAAKPLEEDDASSRLRSQPKSFFLRKQREGDDP